MKNSILIIIGVLLLSSCNNDDDKGKQENTVTDLTLESVLAYIPIDLYRTKEQAIFFNETGEEKILNLEFFEEEREKTIDGLSYKVDFLKTTYRDNTDNNYVINVLVSGEYSDKNNFIEYVDGSILTSVNSGYVPVIGIKKGGLPNFCEFKTELKIHDRNFSDIYHSIMDSQINFDSYSQLYYNTQIGVVAFQGANNEIWLFDRFE